MALLIVVLRCAGGVVRRCFLAIDGAPRIQRPVLAQLAGALARRGEHLPPEADHLARRLGPGIGEERRDVHLGVPEVVAVVAAAGDPLGGDALFLSARRGLTELEQVPAQRLLRAIVAAQLHVAALPELVEPLALLGEQLLDAVVLGAVERACAAVRELGGWGPFRVVVRDELGDADRIARCCPHGVHRLGQVVGDAGAHADAARGVDHVARAARQGHPAVVAAVAEHDLVAVLAGQTRLQHALGELARLARVLAFAQRGRFHVVFVLAVLAVHQLRRHHHRRRRVEECDLEGHHRQMPMGEADHPL